MPALSYAVASPGQTPERRLLAISLPALLPSKSECDSAEAEQESGGSSEPISNQSESTTESSGTIGQPVFLPADLSVSVASAPKNAKPIVTKQYRTALAVNNESSEKIDIDGLLRKVPDLNLSEDGPQILIVHTHTTESYNDDGRDFYTGGDIRTEDNSRNMVRMGEILERSLTEAGYSVIHSQKKHDDDFYQSYTASNATVREYLKQYPSIAVVIDLHRDSLIGNDGTKYRPVAQIDGKPTAQILLLMGVGNGTYPHPDWRENLSLALRIQKEATETYPELMRPILIRASRYNQYLSHGAILVELGSCGNTPEEAERAADLFGKVCAAALDQIREELR